LTCANEGEDLRRSIMQHNLDLPRQHHIRKKVRGSKRRLRSFGNKLEAVLLEIPDENFARDKVWKYHLPSPSKLVDSTNTSNKLRKKFLQLLSDKLIELDTIINGKYRALLIISLPFLSKSRIDICIDSKYFEKLISNTDSPANWTPLSSEKNILKELNLTLPNEYKSKGFSRSSADPNNKTAEENWIIWKA
jgi:hypothetical protein